VGSHFKTANLVGAHFKRANHVGAHFKTSRNVPILGVASGSIHPVAHLKLEKTCFKLEHDSFPS
jgi:hypothetical protein